MATTINSDEKHEISEVAEKKQTEFGGESETPSKNGQNDKIAPCRKSLEQCHNMCTTADEIEGGRLIVWGCGEFGQHGHGHIQDILCADAILTPVWCGEYRFVENVACGSSHTLIITDDNKVYSWGNGNSGQLGIGSSETCLMPRPITFGVTGMAQLNGIACGTRHSFVWAKDGDCYSFGNNYSAQLGYDFRKPDFKENQMSPVYVDTLLNRSVAQVACGARHTVFLFLDGKVASVGSNNKGQLGIDTRDDVVCPTNVTDLQNITCIGCGNSHSLAADETGNLYAWGYGKACGTKEDQLSPKCVKRSEPTANYVMSLAGGDSHSVALINKAIHSWGSNYEGQLGLGRSIKFLSRPCKLSFKRLDGFTATLSVGENTCAAVNDDGFLFMWGKNSSCIIRSDEGSRFSQYDPWPVFLGGWKVHKVACGSWHVACVVTPRDSNGTLCKDDHKSTCIPTTEIEQTTFNEIVRTLSPTSVEGVNIDPADEETLIDSVAKTAANAEDFVVKERNSALESSATQPSFPQEDVSYPFNDLKEVEYAEIMPEGKSDSHLHLCETNHCLDFGKQSTTDSSQIFLSNNSSLAHEEPYGGNLMVKENLDSNTMDQKTDYKDPESLQLLLQDFRTSNGALSSSSDSLIPTSLDPQNKINNIVSDYSKVNEDHQTDEDIICGARTESGINTNPSDLLASEHYNKQKDCSPSKSVNNTVDSICSQAKPIASMSFPVKLEDMHFRRTMSNITLGFTVKENVPVTSSKLSKKVAPNFTNETEGSLSTSGNTCGNLRRTKRPPRTFRRVSFEEHSDYVLPNQTALMCETNTLESWAEARSSIKRTQSSSDMLKRRFSSNSPNQDIQSPRYVPRPPHNVSKLAPRAVTAKNPPAGQNVLFSSCASWRKRR